MKLPGGTTTISGHSGQSLKLSPGFRQRFSFPTSVSTPAQGVCDAALGGGLASRIAAARLPDFLSHCFLSSAQEQDGSNSHTSRSERDSQRNIPPIGAGCLVCATCLFKLSIRARA